MTKCFSQISIILLISCSAAIGQVPRNVPQDGLVGWWPFSGNARDESGAGNHGIISGATLTKDRNGMLDRAFHFNGTSDFITIVDSPYFDFLRSGSFTINFFLRGLSSFESGLEQDKEVPLSFGDFCARQQNRGLMVYLGSNNVLGYAIRGRTGEEKTALCETEYLWIGQWTMVTIIRDINTNTRLYVNGAIVSETYDEAGDILPFEVSRNIEVGRDSSECTGDNDHFAGDLDDIGMWNRALSDEEIQRLYSCDLGISSDSILGYRKVETHQVVTYALRNNPKLSYQWIASGGYMLGASTNHFCDVIWGYDKSGSVCCIVSDSTCTDTLCVTTAINNSPTGGIAGGDIETPTMLVKPNPAADMIDISTALGEQYARYELVDVTGIVVQRTEGVAVRMSVADLAPGVYHIVQRDTMGNVIGMQRVVVKR